MCKPYYVIMDEYDCYTLEEYEQKLLNTMENKRNIQIDLNAAKEWYKQGGDLRKVALQAFTESELNPFPKSWEEYCKINPYVNRYEDFLITLDGSVTTVPQRYFRSGALFAIPSEKRALKFLTLNKLLQIRDYYNQGWKPDWTNTQQKKYIIGSAHNKLFIDEFLNLSHIFTFKTKELCEEFFNNFKEDLEFIKEFL